MNWRLSAIKAIEKLDVLAERRPLAPEDTDMRTGMRHLIVGALWLVALARIGYKMNAQWTVTPEH